MREKKQTEQIRLLFTPEELARIHRQTPKGLPPGRWLRGVVLAKLDTMEEAEAYQRRQIFTTRPVEQEVA